MKRKMSMLLAATATVAGAALTTPAHATGFNTAVKVKSVSTRNDGLITVTVDTTVNVGGCNTTFLLVGGSVTGRAAMVTNAQAAYLSGRQVKVWTTFSSGVCNLDEIELQPWF